MAPARPYLTIDELSLRGATVLLRLDINSPIENGRVAGTDRIEASAETVADLAKKGARVVVLGHQGRKGDDDFTDLSQHAALLGKAAGAPTTFVPDVAGTKAIDAMAKLANGHVLVLDNVRGLDEETRKATPAEHAQASFVATLAKHAKYYVNDAFSASHRAQASLVGFPMLLPSAAGRGLARELDALDKACDNPESPAVYFLGGAKPEDSLMVMRHNLARGKLDLVLTGGLVGELFLVARGHELGAGTHAILEKKGTLKHLAEAEELLDEYDEKILVPEDVAVRTPEGRKEVYIEELPVEEPILDIGNDTVASYARYIEEAGSLFFNGPAGAFEDPAYEFGTKGILQAFARSEAFSLLGGGHTTSALDKFGLGHDDFGYVSLAGGALMAYVAGEKLPAVEALKESRKKFSS